MDREKRRLSIHIPRIPTPKLKLPPLKSPIFPKPKMDMTWMDTLKGHYDQLYGQAAGHYNNAYGQMAGHYNNFAATLSEYMPDLNQEHHYRVAKEIGKQMSVEQILEHPEYPYVNWDLEAEKAEKIDVADGRGGPFKLAYELHGRGPRRIIWIMGLGGYMKTWQRQTKDFAHMRASEYTCLIFDNRGIGDSDKPLLRYTTSEMAADIVELLDHVGWTEPRSVHVVGISMGGMIAQELGLQIPNRICSLNLISTAPRIMRTLSYIENMRNRVNLMWPKSLEGQIAKVKADCYSAEWLKKSDETEFEVEPYPTNGDRFAAGELTKRLAPDVFTPRGFLCQLYAAGFHYKSADQIRQLGDAVGRRRIMVLHGTGDHMIDFIHGKMLLAELGGEESGVTKSFHEGLGHVAPIELRHQFREIIADRVEKTRNMQVEKA